jgi:cob(I)alamin adenosyltransferase
MMTKPLLTFIFLCCAFVVWGQGYSSPAAYGTALFNEHALVSNKNMDYLQYSVHSDDYALIEQKRMELIQQIQQSLTNVRAMPAYEGDTKLRDEIAAVFEAYLASFKVEFEQVNVLRRSSKESYIAMENYLKANSLAEKKLDAASARAGAAQMAFARKYKLQIEEGEEDSGSKSISQLNDYYRAVFLRVFKLSKKDAEFSDALKEQNFGKMDRYRKELDVVCDEHIYFFGKLPDFNGDTAYRDAALALTKFYKDLAVNGYKTMTEVVRKGDKMTNEDVEAFNAVITKLNGELSPLHDAVNEAGDQLFKKNVPKPIETRRI